MPKRKIISHLEPWFTSIYFASKCVLLLHKYILFVFVSYIVQPVCIGEVGSSQLVILYNLCVLERWVQPTSYIVQPVCIGEVGSSQLYPVPRKNFNVISNIIGLPERRNKRKSVLEITKMYYFKF